MPTPEERAAALKAKADAKSAKQAEALASWPQHRKEALAKVPAIMGSIKKQLQAFGDQFPRVHFQVVVGPKPPEQPLPGCSIPPAQPINIVYSQTTKFSISVRHDGFVCQGSSPLSLPEFETALWAWLETLM